MSLGFDEAVTINSGVSGSWVTYDASAVVSGTATGVWGYFNKSDGTTARTLGVRPTGSSETTTYSLGTGNRRHYFAVGLDANKCFDYYVSSTVVDLYLYGEFGTDAVFFDTLQTLTSDAGGWKDVDCSALVPSNATAVIFMTYDTGGGGQILGYRYNGATGFTKYRYCANVTYGIIGLDENKIFEIYRGATSIRPRLVGYLTDGVWHTTPTTIATTATGYQTYDLSSDSPPTGGVPCIWIYGSSSYTFGARYPGSSQGLVNTCYYDQCSVKMSSSNTIEMSISNTAVDAYLWGYLLPSQVIGPFPTFFR